MLFRFATMLLIVAFGGCSLSSTGQRFSVFFEPYSAALDPQAQNTITAAADYASAHPMLPLTVSGFSAPPDPKLDVEGLSAQRAAAVKQLLISDGVRPDRIATAANGITDPKTLPNVSVRRVDINVGY